MIVSQPAIADRMAAGEGIAEFAFERFTRARHAAAGAVPEREIALPGVPAFTLDEVPGPIGAGR